MNSMLRTRTAPIPPPQPGSGRAAAVVVHSIDNCNVEQFLQIAASYGHEKFGYVVTPNVDHLVRYHEDALFRALYRDASYVLMDRFAFPYAPGPSSAFDCCRR